MPTKEKENEQRDALTQRLEAAHPRLKPVLTELHNLAPLDLYMQLEEHDGAAKLADKLLERFKPADVADQGSPGRQVWVQFGLFYLNLTRNYEASTLFSLLYDHLLNHQTRADIRVHKGLALYWLAFCHTALGNAVIAKRYFMLTLCEDAIKDQGHVDPKDSGSYLTLVSHFGLPDRQLRRYVKQVWSLHLKEGLSTRFPEWSLQQLDQEWMTEVPNAIEAGLYRVSCGYASWLLNKTKEKSGKNLEYLAQYLIGAMPGCRALRRVVSEVSDYDVVGVFEGSFIDFRSELGRYCLVECKDWSIPADFTTIAKFCRVLDSTKCRFGMIFSRIGVSGVHQNRHAQREIVKVFQDRGIVIVVFSESDLLRVVNGENFITMLRSKYETVRLDLRGKQPRKTKGKK